MSLLLIPVLSALFVAAIATAGDWVWAAQLLRHKMWYGIAHGGALCLAMGLAVGVPARRPLTGAVGGLVAGILGAGSFYLLAPMLRYNAMFLSWCLLWILLAVLEGPILRRSSAAGALARGLVAAVASGLAFYGVSGMWTKWDPATINYVDHYVRWTIAFLPGFLAMRLGIPFRRS
jgi:hypothetical protein